MSRDIKLLHPRLQEKVKLLQTKFPKLGISETYRTVAEQNQLYAQGRTKPGKIVTYAKGSTYSSQHQWGVAVDYFHNVSGNLYPSAFMKEVAAYAKKIGLAWGGDWKSFKDTPHLYLPDWGSDTSKLKRQYGTPDNFKKSWKQDGAQPESPKPSKPSPPQSNKLTVDGAWGKNTTLRLQDIFKTTEDGIISNQWKMYKDRYPGLTGGWDWKERPNGRGSELIRALQKCVDMPSGQRDGEIGPDTIKAMQKYWKTTQDGTISKGSSLVKAIQKWANSI